MSLGLSATCEPPQEAKGSISPAVLTAGHDLTWTNPSPSAASGMWRAAPGPLAPWLQWPFCHLTDNTWKGVSALTSLACADSKVTVAVPALSAERRALVPSPL